MNIYKNSVHFEGRDMNLTVVQKDTGNDKPKKNNTMTAIITIFLFLTLTTTCISLCIDTEATLTFIAMVVYVVFKLCKL